MIRACLLVLLFSCSRPPQLVTLFGKTMGTTYTIKYYQVPLALPKERIGKEIEARLLEINQKMSTYLPDSEISTINKSFSNDWIKVSRELYQVLKAAKKVSRVSQGYFDITLGPLINLWGFGPQKAKRVPKEWEIQKLLSKIGHHHLLVDQTSARIKKLRPDIYLDLSSLAKGYGVDALASILEEQGISNYMVEIGGEVKVKGQKPTRPWAIGLENPQYEKRGLKKVIHLKDEAMATSGDYRNFFKQGGKLYSHTIDFKTGMPIKHNLVSVTVLHPNSCMLADAWATALLAMGPKAFEFAEKYNLSALFYFREAGELIEKKTTGLKESVK